MHSFNQFCRTVFILIIFTSVLVFAQENKTITKEAKAMVIEKMSSLLNDNYVFPEVAEKIGRHLKSKLDDGSFDQINDKKEFAERLTKEVQSISNDKHMRVRLRPAQPLSPTKEPNPIAEYYEFKVSMQQNNYGFTRVEKLEDNVGLLEIVGFPPLQLAKESADLAMKYLAGADALIIDCRRNGGGNPDLIQYVCSYLFEKPTHINSIYSRTRNQTDDYVTSEKVDGTKFSDQAVFVLTSSRTFSGGEEFAYDIQTQKRGIIIGEVTGGGANPGQLFPVGEELGIFIPTGRAINPITKTNWEGTGVKPDIEIEASKALDTAITLARTAAQEHRRSKDKIAYKLIDEIGVNMETAEQLFSTNNTAKAEELVKTSIQNGIDGNLLSEESINILGYEYLNKEKFNLAIAIFKINTMVYPQSANVYDSLGEAYMKSGNKEKAVFNYKKVLDLDPQNAHASDMLKKLEVN